MHGGMYTVIIMLSHIMNSSPIYVVRGLKTRLDLLKHKTKPQNIKQKTKSTGIWHVYTKHSKQSTRTARHMKYHIYVHEHDGCDTRIESIIIPSPGPLRLELVHPGARHGALSPLPRVAVPGREGGAALAVHSPVAVLPLVHGPVCVPVTTCSS